MNVKRRRKIIGHGTESKGDNGRQELESWLLEKLRKIYLSTIILYIGYFHCILFLEWCETEVRNGSAINAMLLLFGFFIDALIMRRHDVC